MSDLEQLEAVNAQLNEQLRLGELAEQRLHQAQHRLELQLRRLRKLDDFALAAARLRTRDSVIDRAARLVMELWATQAVIAIPDLAVAAGRVALVNATTSEVIIPAPVLEALRSPRKGTMLSGDCANPRLTAWLDAVAEEVEAERRAFASYQCVDVVIPINAGVLVIRTSRISAFEHVIDANDVPMLDLFSRHLASNLERVHLHFSLEARIRERTLSLEALGSLSAGVAHAINNPLTFILHNTTFLAELCEEMKNGIAPSPSDLADAIETLEANTNGLLRIRDIVADLNTYAATAYEHREESPLDTMTERASIRMQRLDLIGT